jgi:hypothetical protein
LFDWPTIWPDLNLEVSTVDPFVMIAAKGLQFTEPENDHIAVMRGDVMHNGCGHGAALGFAHLA